MGVGACCSRKGAVGRPCFPGTSWAGPGKPSPRGSQQDSSLVLRGRCNTAAPAAGLLKDKEADGSTAWLGALVKTTARAMHLVDVHRGPTSPDTGGHQGAGDDEGEMLAQPPGAAPSQGADGQKAPQSTGVSEGWRDDGGVRRGGGQPTAEGQREELCQHLGTCTKRLPTQTAQQS